MRFLIPLLFCSITVLSQADSNQSNFKLTPFNPKGTYNTFAAKFKLLPWVMGNNGGLNGALGIEQSFYKRHSIGVEWCFNRWAEHYDNDSGYSDDGYHRDRAILTNYRFYYGSMSKKRPLCMYNGISYRYGRSTTELSKAIAQNDNTFRIVNYHAVGFVTGLFFGLNNLKNFGIDMNAGIYYNMKTIQNTYDFSPNPVNTTAKVATCDFRVWLTFTRWFGLNGPFKNQNH